MSVTLKIQEWHMYSVPFYEYSINIDGYDNREMLDQTNNCKEDDLSLLTMHSHAYAELFICTESPITLKTESGFIQLQQGEIAIIPPNIPHICITNPIETEWKALGFSILQQNINSTSDIRNISELFMNNKEIIIVKQAELYTKATNLFHLNRSSGLILLFTLCELLSQISETQSIRITNKTSSDSSIQSELSRLKLLDQIIAVDFTKKLTAEDIAEKLFISSRQLDRIAKKRYGKSIRALIIEKRINTATELLCTTNMTAEKIGITVGFGSTAGFLREFSKKYSLTPAKYRKIYSKKEDT